MIEKGLFVEAVFYRPIVNDTVVKPSDSIGIVSDSIGNLSEQENQIIEFIRNHSRITSKAVEEILELKEARARRVLKQMVDKGLIIRLGSGRSTCYVLKNRGI